MRNVTIFDAVSLEFFSGRGKYSFKRTQNALTTKDKTRMLLKSRTSSQEKDTTERVRGTLKTGRRCAIWTTQFLKWAKY